MRYFKLLIMAVFLMQACKKEVPVSPGLFGKWEMRRQSGGFAGMDSVYKPGNGRILQFSSDSTFRLFNKGVLVNQGWFHINKNFYHYGQDFYDQLVLGNSVGDVFNLSGTKFTYGLDFDDGIAAEYVKIGN